MKKPSLYNKKMESIGSNMGKQGEKMNEKVFLFIKILFFPGKNPFFFYRINHIF